MHYEQIKVLSLGNFPRQGPLTPPSSFRSSTATHHILILIVHDDGHGGGFEPNWHKEKFFGRFQELPLCLQHISTLSMPARRWCGVACGAVRRRCDQCQDAPCAVLRWASSSGSAFVSNTLRSHYFIQPPFTGLTSDLSSCLLELDLGSLPEKEFFGWPSRSTPTAQEIMTIAKLVIA